MISLIQGASFWKRAAALVAILALSVLAFMLASDFDDQKDRYRIEAAKIFLQFVLITLGGGLALAYVNERRDRDEQAAADRRRDEERAADLRRAEEERIADQRQAEEQRAAAERLATQERAAARRAGLQELLIELGDAHRRLKVVKRQMRAQIMRGDQEHGATINPPYSIRAEAFERAMDALLNAQIAAEEVRDRIAIRTDLLEAGQIDRIRTALRYGARYFHDVYQDYERCKVERRDPHVVVTAACKNLSNFLVAKAPPDDLPKEQAGQLETQFAIIRNDDRSLQQRHTALSEIEKLRALDPEKRRYRIVATECFALAADEIRESLRYDKEEGPRV